MGHDCKNCGNACKLRPLDDLTPLELWHIMEGYDDIYPYIHVGWSEQQTPIMIFPEEE